VAVAIEPLELGRFDVMAVEGPVLNEQVEDRLEAEADSSVEVSNVAAFVLVKGIAETYELENRQAIVELVADIEQTPSGVAYHFGKLDWDGEVIELAVEIEPLSGIVFYFELVV
jgi:hypothetical protein